MKKFFITIILLSLCVIGCEKNNEEPLITNNENIKVQEEIKEPDYIDNNKTPIGIYRLNGNTLTRLHQINTDLVIEKDIGVFQIFPSNEEIIQLDKAFGQAFYEEWKKYNTNNNLKIGFNIKFTLNNGSNIDYNILDPSHTFDHWEQLMNYLYDDYANMGKGFYSHIENDQYNDSTLFTAFKMQSSYQCGDINSGIKLSVFTYDDQDDFLNDNYRGNSIYSFNICINGKTC